MAGENDDIAEGGAPRRFSRSVAVNVALVVLLGFATLVTFFVNRASTADAETWSRYVYLFGAMEALVFTTLGWIFGREVNRHAVRIAEARADQVTARAEEVITRAAQHEANGRALRAAVDARSNDQPSDLARLAKALFPDR